MKDILVQYDFVDKEGFPTNMADVTRFCEFSISSWRSQVTCWDITFSASTSIELDTFK
ncbi:hypothetical protein Taro_034261 [Colocasia esculenta]|uniref:Uncharacterized protein n=1 Tax=Colocasia esculenta TaxID=4460 RepID=A0A843VQT5_COLES|nr:hypothetical protein [Colocasia esculenta]